LRPTTTEGEVIDEPPAPPDEIEAEGRGEGAVEAPDAQPAPAKASRSRRPKPAGKTKARNLHLTDDIHDRLWLLARQRRTTVSAVANDLLDKALPRWELKRQG
jgi:hypothetical protein